MAKRTARSLAFRLLALALGALGGSTARADDVCDAKERPANLDFTLRDVAGNEVRLAEYSGQVIVLDFWATWCAPCRIAIPDLVELYERSSDAETKSVGLTRLTATLEGGVDVVAPLSLSDLQRLHDAKTGGHGREIVLEWPTVEGHLAGAVHETNPGNRGLAATGGLDEGLGHQSSTFRTFSSRAWGFWAACG